MKAIWFSSVMKFCILQWQLPVSLSLSLSLTRTHAYIMPEIFQILLESYTCLSPDSVVDNSVVNMNCLTAVKHCTITDHLTPVISSTN